MQTIFERCDQKFAIENRVCVRFVVITRVLSQLFFHQCCLTEELTRTPSVRCTGHTTWYPGYTKRERWLSSRVRTPWRVCTFLSKIEFTTKSCGTKRRYRVCAYTSGRLPPPLTHALGRFGRFGRVGIFFVTGRVGRVGTRLSHVQINIQNNSYKRIIQS